MLRIENLTKKFGGIVAVNDCSFEVKKGLVTGIIGPNGSGKTTIFDLITGFYRPDSGKILFENNLLNGLASHKIAQMGIARTFQATRVFSKMTTLENLLVAQQKGEKVNQERALELLKFCDLIDLRDEYAGNLSYGQQKLLSFALALVLDPKLALLDEPVAGINPIIIQRIVENISELRSKNKTFVLIEHNVRFVLGICDVVIVLDQGRKIAEGTPEDVSSDKRVVDAYLGRRRKDEFTGK